MTFKIVQNDTAPSLISVLRDNNKPIDLSGFDNVFFYVEDKYQRVVIEDDARGNVGEGRVGVLDDKRGKVEYVFDSDDTSDAGTYYAEWQVIYQDGSVETFPTDGKIEIKITEEIQ